MKQTVQKLLEKGILISPDLLDSKLDEKEIEKLSKDVKSDETLLIDQNLIKENNKKNIETEDSVEVLDFFVERPKKHTVPDFVSHFNARFNAIQGMLKHRQELSQLTSINRVLLKSENEKTSIIGMVTEKSVTKNGNVMLKLEDNTGIINVLVSKKRQDMLSIAMDIQLDEIIGISGSTGSRIVFANAIVFPDIPLTRELKKSPFDEWCAILGDLHVGSNLFLKDEFMKFIEWINGRAGTDEQKKIASKIKYVIIPGDLVEGVGVYPNQDKDLEIIDLKDQYDEFAKLVKLIPNHIELISIPGNHDVGRLAEPQLPFRDEFSRSLYEMPNMKITSNPCWLKLGKKKGFEGFDVLMYHGYSLIYISENVPSIRDAGGQKRSDLIMKYMLQRRHLAPTHGSNLYVPFTDKDPLVIEKIPDIFITGHIHRVSVSQYRSVTNINGSCWADISEDQEKRGLEPQPGRVPVINLQTREVKIMNFYKKK